MTYTAVVRDTKGRIMALSFRHMKQMDESDFRKFWFHALNEGSDKINGRYEHDWNMVLVVMRKAGFTLEDDAVSMAMEDRIRPGEMDKLEETLLRRLKFGIRV